MIMTDTGSTPDNVFFILSGQCLIIREIYLVKEVFPFGRTVYHLPTGNIIYEIIMRDNYNHM